MLTCFLQAIEPKQIPVAAPAPRRSRGLEPAKSRRRRDRADTLHGHKKFCPGAVGLNRFERVVAPVGAGPDGIGTSLVATDFSGGSASTLYERGRRRCG